MTKKIPLKDTAEKICVHLKRIEADPELNPYFEMRGNKWVRTDNSDNRMKGHRFYNGAYASASGPRIFVTYVGYQGQSSITREEAEKYLAWLDAGNVGNHFKALRAMKEEVKS